MSSLQTKKVDRKNESWNVSTDFDLWLERRAELGTVF